MVGGLSCAISLSVLMENPLRDHFFLIFRDILNFDPSFCLGNLGNAASLVLIIQELELEDDLSFGRMCALPGAALLFR